MIVELGMECAGPFRGRHVLELGPGPHALVARHDLDRLRSNMIGKSFVLEVVNFLVTGGWKRERGYDADGWVTRGEREGRAWMVLEDGTRVERWKRRGQSRQVRVRLPGREGEAAQDDATAALLRHLRFDAADFSRTAYLEQKHAARLLYVDPSERVSVVSGWLGLEKGERAEEIAGDLASNISAEVDRLTARRDAARAQAGEEPAPVDDARAELARAEARAVEVQTALGVEQARGLHERTVRAHADRIARGRRLRAEVDADDGRAEAEAVGSARALAAAQLKFDTVKEELRRRGLVAEGRFDGRCPVAQIECPVKDRINADRRSAEEARAAAQAKLDAARQERDAAARVNAPVAEAAREAQLARRDLERLRDETRASAAEARRSEAFLEEHPVVDVEALQDEARHLLDRTTELRRAIWESEAAARARAASMKAIEAAEGELAIAHTRLRSALKARAIIRAAHRRVAERAIGEVEAAANDAIAGAGVDLTVSARWEREGKGLARSCEECGAAFPASAKVKECPRCASPRGNLTAQRLDFVLSDSSGGADDLAGAAWQLAAGGWLLARRGSPWATAMLDEPTAAMDPVLRRGFVRHLSNMCRASSYRQAIVIAHSADAVDALPRRIVVRCDAAGNRSLSVE